MNWTLLANSLLVAGASTLLALIIGGTAAIVLSASAHLPRQILLTLTIGVLAMPPFLVMNCWLDLFGANGVLHRWLPLNIFSLAGAVWVLALLLWPIPALAIWSAWQKLERVHFEVDAALRGCRLLSYLLWPAAKANVVLSATVVFVLALNNFAVPTILQVKVFASEVWVKFNTNLDALAALEMSWPLLFAPICMLLFLRRAEVPWPRETQADIAPVLRRQLGTTFLSASASIVAFILFVALAAPLAQLTITPRTWSEFLSAWTASRNAVINSLVYALGAAALAVAISLVLSRVRGLGSLWIFFLIPGVLLGIGAITAFNRPGFEFFSRTAAIVVAVLVVRYIAITRSIARAAFASVDREIIDAARLDGARGTRLFRCIVLPQIAPPIAAAAYLVYLLCLWDVETILLVIPPGGETLALRIFNLLHYGHNAHVNALCMLLLLLAIAPLLLFAICRAIGAPSVGSARRDREDRRAERVLGAPMALLIAVVALGLCSCRPQTRALENSFPLQSSIFSQVEIIGSRGTGPGQFNKPRSLALDTNDDLFVVDMTGRVQKFSPDGKFLLSWQMPQTDLGKPKGMCRDRDGNIVVLEPHYQRVNHFTPDGKLIAQWGVKGTNAGELTLPRAIAVDTKNNVIISEYTLVDRVQKFSAYGKRVLATWGTPGLAPGEFNRAEGVCVDSADQIFVADSCNHRIQVFSSDAKFLRAYGKAGELTGELSYPYDICVDEQRRQYVCEFGNSRIQVFDRNDRALEIIGRAGSAPGEFNNPWSIALDSKGNLYIADSRNDRVQKLVRKVESRASSVESRTHARLPSTFDSRPSTDVQ
jgi:ABC-type Fe3+ transport system permease subunit/sugar lactone lactonase YvrE